MSRPKIEIPLNILDRIMEFLALLFLFLLIGFPIYYFSELPDIIPSHFNGSGEPDKFNNKSVIWLLPIIGIFLFTVLTILNKSPHLFNYPQNISIENAKHQYRLSTKLIRTLKMLIVIFFFYLVYGTIQISLSHMIKLNPVFLYAFLICLFVTIGVYIYLAKKSDKIN